MENEKNLSRANVHCLFDAISKKYDLANILLSFGMDRYWRRSLANQLPRKNPLVVLDLATGTGDQLFSILKKRNQLTGLGIDLSTQMLAVAKKKQLKKDPQGYLRFEIADALALPSHYEGSFDAVTLSFGIRNMLSIEQCFQEIFRALKPGGLALILEFGLPTNPLLKKLYLYHLKYILPLLGACISNHKSAYTYLSKTIQTFPYGEKFLDMMKSQGFHSSHYQKLSFGSVYLYVGVKNL